jgi:hypothetical protein
MLKLVPLLLGLSAGLFIWFVYAFGSETTSWDTSEPVQIVTGVGALLGLAASLAIVMVSAVRAIRRRASRRRR